MSERVRVVTAEGDVEVGSRLDVGRRAAPVTHDPDWFRRHEAWDFDHWGGSPGAREFGSIDEAIAELGREPLRHVGFSHGFRVVPSVITVPAARFEALLRPESWGDWARRLAVSGLRAVADRLEGERP